MKQPGDVADPTLIEARRGLLDALEALGPHASMVVLVGAQAIYLHTATIVTGITLFTKDADVLLVPPVAPTPDIEAAMRQRGFHPGPQPGIWIDQDRQVDLLVPDGMSPRQGRRSSGIPGHGAAAARNVPGLEGAAVDHAPMEIGALDTQDARSAVVQVAGPAALLVSKAFKLRDRTRDGNAARLGPKDAFDAYRLLQLPAPLVAPGFERMARDQRSAHVAMEGLALLSDLFATVDAPGTILVGEHIRGIGDEATARLSVVELMKELVEHVHNP